MKVRRNSMNNDINSNGQTLHDCRCNSIVRSSVSNGGSGSPNQICKSNPASEQRHLARSLARPP
eukprot:861914-Amphidinium_carterae.1